MSLDDKIKNMELNRKKRIEDYRNIIKNDQKIHQAVEKSISENYYTDYNRIAYVNNSHLGTYCWKVRNYNSIDEHIMTKYNFNDIGTGTRCNVITEELNKRSHKVRFYCDTFYGGHELNGDIKL